MKKIIGLVIAIAVVLSLVGSGTWALFSDTETSTDNTFTAGVIDLVLDQTDHVVTADVDLTDLKPCMTGYLTITLTPSGTSNPMHVWKHIVPIIEEDRAEGGEPTEPEDAWYDANNGGEPKNDIDRYIHFDMEVNDAVVIAETDGWLLSTNTNTTETGEFSPAVQDYTAHPLGNGVAGYWIYLGILDPTGGYTDSVTQMVIEESFHMDAYVDNWAQGDVLTFDEEFYALQAEGSPTWPSANEELPGHGSGLPNP